MRDILHSNEDIPPVIPLLEEQIVDELTNSVESEEIIAEVTEIKAPQEDKLEELIEIEENNNDIVSTTRKPATTTINTPRTTTEIKIQASTITTKQEIKPSLEINVTPEIITEIEIGNSLSLVFKLFLKFQYIHRINLNIICRRC